MGVFLGIIIFLLMAGSAALAVFGFRNSKRVRAAIGALGALTFLILFVFIPFGFVKVDAGEVAVVKVWGKPTGIKTAGLHFRNVVSTSYQVFDIKIQQVDIKTDAYSHDAQSVALEMTMQFSIQADKAMEIAKSYGDLSVLTSRITAIAQEKAKIVISSKSAMTVIETRETLSPTVIQELKPLEAQYYVTIDNFVIHNLVFNDAFELAVENKMIAEQEKLKAQYDKEKAIIKAEEELEVAKKQAEAAIEKAKGEAQAEIEIATAQAQAIKLKSVEVARALGFSITETAITNPDSTVSKSYNIDFAGKTADEVKLITDYIKYIEYLNKWDGKLPGVLVTDGGAEIIIPAP